ncbi:MAG TPA: ComF family protein, partial [Candidatus Sumerlaeota bacterium]|nr:ComF family protein [Candidatus Sumerlaeota bacterium]
PMHFTRRWKRGYNHAEVLAQEFAILAHLPCRPELLTRVRRTPRQALLPPDQRATNVLGAFAAEHPDTVAGRRIGLFDDVLTSGSTVNECARTLKLAGAAEVHVLALSRA